MSATYQPPPSSGRLPYVGFGSSIPAIGGLTSGEVQALEASENKKSEFVEVECSEAFQVLKYSNFSQMSTLSAKNYFGGSMQKLRRKIVILLIVTRRNFHTNRESPLVKKIFRKVF